MADEYTDESYEDEDTDKTHKSSIQRSKNALRCEKYRKHKEEQLRKRLQNPSITVKLNEITNIELEADEVRLLVRNIFNLYMSLIKRNLIKDEYISDDIIEIWKKIMKYILPFIQMNSQTRPQMQQQTWPLSQEEEMQRLLKKLENKQ
jgi:hypothetical protein